VKTRSLNGLGSRVQNTETQDHHDSHQDLLWAADDAGRRQGIDAIIVPTARPPAYLAQAAALAHALGCTLLTLHSTQWTSAAKAARRLPRDIDLLAIDIQDPAQLRLPSWETTRLLAPTVFKRRSDTSAKRNIALVLSRMLGWSRVLFLDDDITGLDPDDVRRASGLLDTYNAVGLHVGGFPDHSVVCHAYLQAGGSQQAFIGGGALAVHLERSTSFFPDIYNDDWFFLLDGGKGIQPVGVTGTVRQFPYDPFRNTDRARGEELGDVLAEGIYWLLDQGGSVTDADQAHWIRFLVRRRRFIERVLRMVEQQGTLESAERARRIAALKGSLGRLQLITPTLCEDYLRAWAADRQRWHRDLQKPPIRGIQRFAGPERRHRALGALSRPGAPRLTWESRAQGSPLIAVSPLTTPVRHAPEPDGEPRDREEPDVAAVVAAPHGLDSVSAGI